MTPMGAFVGTTVLTAVVNGTATTPTTTTNTTNAANAAANAADDDDDTAQYTTTEYILTVTVSILVTILLGLATHYLPRSRGRNWLYHAAYVAFALVLVFVLPSPIQSVVFSKISVMIVGTIFPMYESVRAVCTPPVDDDKAWLQYWVAQALVAFTTAWMDDFHMIKKSSALLHWQQFEIIYYLWLLLPFTDGAALTFDYFTRPILAPLVEPLTKRTTTFISAFTATAVNITHIVVAWIFFVLLPRALQRFLVVLVGVSYPFMASIVAVTTERDDDDTFWLTYWSGYGLLFLAMDLLENYLHKVYGFYATILLATLYLMLPMTQGAEKLFRHVLVPIAGLRQELLKGDALRVKKDLLQSNFSPTDVAKLRRQIAASFANDDSDLPLHLQTKAQQTTQTGGAIYGSVATRELEEEVEEEP